MTENEFSHLLRLDEIGGQKHLHIAASKAERSALAARFGLVSLGKLEAEIALSRDGPVVEAKGRFEAQATQACIASGEPVESSLSEDLMLRFIPQPEHGAEEEFELEEDDCDALFHDGKQIDVGEAVAQSLALTLDPYPRSAEAGEILKKAGVKSEEEAREESGPFAALSALKKN